MKKITVIFCTMVVLFVACSKVDTKIEKQILTPEQIEGIWYLCIENGVHFFYSETSSEFSAAPPLVGQGGVFFPSLSIQDGRAILSETILRGCSVDYTGDLDTDYKYVNNELRLGNGIVLYVRDYNSTTQIIKVACNGWWCSLSKKNT